MTNRLYIIIEVVDGGTPTATCYPKDKIKQIFSEMVEELGYERDGNHAYDPNDACRTNITLTHITPC